MGVHLAPFGGGHLDKDLQIYLAEVRICHQVCNVRDRLPVRFGKRGAVGVCLIHRRFPLVERHGYPCSLADLLRRHRIEISLRPGVCRLRLFTNYQV